MALPGSKLYYDALKKNVKLPETYEGYSFHSYETLPLPTDTLSPKEILKFRDEAFVKYHSNTKFLERVKTKFGDNAVNQIKSMLEIKLKRKLFDENSIRN